MKKINKRKKYIILRIQKRKLKKLMRKNNVKRRCRLKSKNIKSLRKPTNRQIGRILKEKIIFENADINDNDFRKACANLRKIANDMEEKDRTKDLMKALSLDKLCDKQILDKLNNGGIVPIVTLISEYINLIGDNVYSKQIISNIRGKKYKNNKGDFIPIYHKFTDISQTNNKIITISDRIEELKETEKYIRAEITEDITNFINEAISNIANHAYDEKTKNDKWLFFWLEYQPKLVTVVIYDIGYTIPSTIKTSDWVSQLKKIFIENISKKNGKHDKEWLLFAFDKTEEDRISRTKLENRGHGLLNMVELTNKGKDIELEVHSGSASINISKGIVNDSCMKEFETSIQGTLLILKIGV